MAKNSSEDGCAGVVGGAIFGIFVIISLVPKQVWIALGVVAAVAALVWLGVKGLEAFDNQQKLAEKQRRAAAAAQAAAEKRQREEAVRQARQKLVALVGEERAAVVQAVRTSVQQVQASEAAKAGWLGDVDFTTDVAAITENFGKAYSLRRVADQLSALANPSAEDRKILAEATATAEGLERSANECATLIAKCAVEANKVDQSLRAEREEARTAEQRAELHAKLSAMLYGIEATPTAAPEDSTADAVMARVQAYREIKSQISAR